MASYLSSAEVPTFWSCKQKHPFFAMQGCNGAAALLFLSHRARIRDESLSL